MSASAESEDTAKSGYDRPAGSTGQLSRTLGLGLLILYGLGITVGAGIYVLIGAAADRAGAYAPIGFVIAAVVMGLSAASFAELAGRMPVSAGEAAYVRAGFRSDAMGLLVGGLVIAAAVVAAAAITTGAVGYIRAFVVLPPWLLAASVLLVMGTIAAAGILESATVAAVMTLIEVGGLVLVIGGGIAANPQLLLDAAAIWPGAGHAAAWPGIFGAALLAFFAFIGFEGMVNLAEEVREPERTIPKAIFATLAIATVLYILVLLVAMSAVDRNELARSEAPLVLVFARVTSAPLQIMAAIAIVAALNGIIAQIVLAARVTYGLAGQGSLPEILGKVHPRTRTPLLATALATLAAIVLALFFPIDRLADTTSQIMLTIFVLVNASLAILKWRGEPPPRNGFVAPIAIPVLGCASCLLLLLAPLVQWEIGR